MGPVGYTIEERVSTQPTSLYASARRHPISYHIEGRWSSSYLGLRDSFAPKMISNGFWPNGDHMLVALNCATSL